MSDAGIGGSRPELDEGKDTYNTALRIPYPVASTMFAYFVIRTGRLSPRCLFISALPQRLSLMTNAPGS